MFKNFITPIQMWLLAQGRCVGCGMPLKKGQVKSGKKGKITTCKCKRIYVYDTKSKKYRRALMSEI